MQVQKDIRYWLQLIEDNLGIEGYYDEVGVHRYLQQSLQVIKDAHYDNQETVDDDDEDYGQCVS
jgi:hypothetical protein